MTWTRTPSPQWTITLLLLPLLVGSLAVAADRVDKPNFIVIFVDNFGNGDLGCFGSELHRTPHVDRLAAEGTKFTSFYVSSGVCTPSRASLMTGCYAQRVGMHVSDKNSAVLQPVARQGLNPSETTIAETLKQAGYATGIFGKWHLGDQPPFLPTRQGFDEFFGIPYSDDMTKDKSPDTWPELPLMRGEKVIEAPPDRDYLVKRCTEEAIAFIERNRSTPFFVYLPHTMPGSTAHPFSSPAFRGKSRNGDYGDSVEELDWSTGQIMEALRRLHLDEKTLIVWTSDNGAVKRNPLQGSSAPYRGFGYDTSEGAMRMPCVMRWPGKIPAGKVQDEVCSTMDLLPTLASLSGAPLPERPIDGRDMTPLLLGTPGAKSHWDETGFYYYRLEQLQAVRSGPWKLYLPLERKYVALNRKSEPAKLELYDVRNDVQEDREVSRDHPELVQRLTALAEHARAELGDANRSGTGQRTAGFVDNAQPLLMAAPPPLSPPMNTPTSHGMSKPLDVFVGGQAGYFAYRIPSLVTTKRGTLLAFCEGRKTSLSDDGDNDLVLRRSTDDGQTWQELQIVHEEGGDAVVTIGNPTAVVDQSSGRVLLLMNRKNGRVLLTHSDDDGVSWSPVNDITSSTSQPNWGWYALGPGVGIQLERGPFRGRLVIPANHRETNDRSGPSSSHIIYSDDHGETWKLGGIVGLHTNECQVVECVSQDGSELLINMRNHWGRSGGKPERAGRRLVSRSRDGGLTWTAPTRHEQLVEPTCQASLMRYQWPADSARSVLLFSNPNDTRQRIRTTVRASFDEGHTWPVERLIDGGSSGYSCLSRLQSGRIGLIYERDGYKRLSFVTFDLGWLEASTVKR